MRPLARTHPCARLQAAESLENDTLRYSATPLSIAGKVKGSVRAADSLEIKTAGVVLGDVYTAKLFGEPGGYFDGTCPMPAPEPEKHPAPSLGPKDRT